MRQRRAFSSAAWPFEDQRRSWRSYLTSFAVGGILVTDTLVLSRESIDRRHEFDERNLGNCLDFHLVGSDSGHFPTMR